ncbi:hypothetical protein ABZP36_003874 [Zizania latifolia]
MEEALKALGTRVCLFTAVSEIGAAVRSRSNSNDRRTLFIFWMLDRGFFFKGNQTDVALQSTAVASRIALQKNATASRIALQSAAAAASHETGLKTSARQQKQLKISL